MKNKANFDECDIMEQIDETIENEYFGMHYVVFDKNKNGSKETDWRLGKKVKTMKRDPKYISENN